MKRYLKICFIIAVLAPVTWIFAGTLNNDRAALIAIFELIQREYVEKVTDKKLVTSAISGMLTGLDPHSSFLDEKDFEEMKTVTKGEFGGLGIEIMSDAHGIRIITPMDDSPAYKAGIKAGDLIVAVNNELITNMTSAEAVNKMRGPKNTKVTITLIREGLNEPLELTLVRDIIKANPVKHHLYNDIGYVRVSTFSAQTADSLKKAIEDLKTSAGKTSIKGYVLDLRNNSGGLLDQAIAVSDLFIDKGIIVSVKGRDQKEQKTFEAQPGNMVDDLPMVILINNGSASASEIVAGALQDHKRAIILGTKSFGKGSVQSVIPLPGYGALRLTTALYYTPSGKSIQAEGIIPDIEVAQAKMELITGKESKLQISEASLKNHLINKTQVNSTEAKQDDIKNKAELWTKLYEQDYQLARAVDLLKSIQILQKR